MIKINNITNFEVEIKSPPSKAHTLRALLIASLAKGISIIKNPLLAEDQINMINCLKDLGVNITVEKDEILIEGVDGSFNPTSNNLNVGDSGVTMNFLASAACLAKESVIIKGSKRLNERPILEVINGLKQLGCNISYLEKEGFPPIKVKTGIKGGIAKINGAKSSQYFSSIMIVAPYANKNVSLICLDEMTEKPYVNITQEMIELFGGIIQNNDYKEINIENNKYVSKEIIIEGDYSSTSFFFLAAAISNSRIKVTGLNPNSKQGDKKFLDLIKKMGCEVEIESDRVIVTGKDLIAIDEDMSDIPDLVPPLAIAAAFADGTTKIRNIGHLVHKESNRIDVMIEGLSRMGIKAECDKDSLIIEGNREKIHGAKINPHNDHRIAMSFGIAGLVTRDQEIENENCVAKSFPNFWERIKVFYK